VNDTVSALEEYEILKKLDPYPADILHKIIETKGKIPSETLASYPEGVKEELKQTETALTAPQEFSPLAVPVPQKEVLRSQTADASVKKLISSDKIDKAANTSTQETPRHNEQILGKNIYTVQVSVFDNKKNAMSLTKRLSKKGYNAFLKTEYRVDQNTRYKVLVGKFSEKAMAEKQVGTIFKKEKLKSIIIKL